MAVITPNDPQHPTTPSGPGEERHAAGRVPPAAAWAALGVGCLAMVVHVLAAGDLATVTFAAVGIGSVIAVLVGIRLNRPEVRRPWYALLAAQALWIAGDLSLLGWPGVGVADAIYVVGYLVLLAAVLGFLQARQPGRARDSLLDAAIIVVGLGVVVWELTVDPYQRQTGAAWGELALIIAYPLLGLLLFGVAARLLAPHGRTPAVWLLGLALLALPVGEVLRVVSIVGGGVLAGLFLSVWVLYYALVSAAALHPSMRALARRIPDGGQPLSGGRLAALVAMALTPAAVAVIESLRGLPVNLVLIVAATLVLSLLIIARISDERRRALEQALASMALVELLQRVASAANEASTVDEVIDRTLGDICRTTGWPVGHVFLGSEDEGGSLVSSTIWHLSDTEAFAELRRITEEDGLSTRAILPHRALAEGRPVWVRDVREDPTHVRAAIARSQGRDLGVRSHVAFPVGVDDERAQLVLEFFSSEVAEPSEQFLEVIAFVADQLRRVVERSRAREGVERARDAALESTRLKSEFLATMSHEIRTPMNAVIGMTGLLLDTELDPTQRWYASSVRAAGESLLTIINDILDFSKIEAGKLTIETSDFSVDRLVEEVADLLGEVARPKGVDVYSYCHPEVPVAVHGDAGRVRQILVNLVGNAVKFTPQGEVIVRVRTADEEPPDGKLLLRFEVIDTGIGMSEASVSQLFEPFVQADQSTTRRYGGTGLGLSISKRLVEIMGGQIGVTSVEGEGSSFWFTLPLEQQVGAAHSDRDRSSVLAGKRILILDDNPTNREIVERQVEAWGMRPRSVERGPEALRELRSAADDGAPFAVAALDLNMPDMDGIEVAIRIKADERIADVALALLTSTEGLEEAAQAEAAGIRAFLRKPVRQSQLYDTLMQILLPTTGAQEERPAAVTPRRSGTILLVEDNPANQLVGAKMTERLGFHVEIAGDGAAALEALERRGYDAILMDCQMPVMDGYEASRRIRTSGAPYADVPIIALTAGAMAEDRERCLAAGMSDYITKPVRPVDLETVLDRYVPPDPEPTMGPSADRQDGAAAAEEDGATGPAETPGPLPVLDRERWDVLVDLTSERREALHKIVELFLADAPARAAAIQDLEDPQAARQAAHSLRGSAASLGLAALADLCEQIEDALAGDGQVDARLLEAVPAELARANTALRSAMAEAAA